MKKTTIPRPEYIDFLLKWKDEDLIKVLTGVRRCGKSTIFEMYKNLLIEDKVQENRIISINFEDYENSHLAKAEVLHEFVKSRIKTKEKHYLFLDEIQNVPNFEKVVNSLYLDKRIDIYITGSNAYVLSGELATFLSGRYIELKMLPLSFKEFISVRKEDNLRLLYQKYLATSFPYASQLHEDKKTEYLEGLYSSIVIKDIATRLSISDLSILQRIIRYLYSEIGSLQNINKITNTLISKGNKINYRTVLNYINGIENSLLIYKAERYNVKGRKLLGGNVKYYAVDMGLRQFIAGDRVEDFGHVLENIVYLELLRRGYQVYIGIVENYEVDFLAIKGQKRIYVQVAHNTENEKTLKRELKSLQMIKDNYPKFLLTMDDIMGEQNFDGIIKTNVLKWLIE